MHELITFIFKHDQNWETNFAKVLFGFALT